MRVRSWMAALALIMGTSILIGRGLSAQGLSSAQQKGQDAEPKKSGETRSEADASKPPDSRLPVVKLNLLIAGLGQQGCDIEVKPANAGCKFRLPSPQHISSEGKAAFELKDVEIRSADRTFTMAITVHEPGQAAKTVYRGFRMANRAPASQSSATASIPTFTCYLSSRVASGASDARTRK
ncbi:MAG: hypothetical protein ACLQGP_01745 [Isosphaeraceae bacterium]